ncbi:VOC family protein [Aestuariimicrobium ganziense]|uniref:VOC family protein n=1 Tax=Aestuariimicrobium ganziense TaxID=2773677 RepID=UPI001941FB21|nr:VOC family protein [Aestuariimicrobium ganziense]
MQQRTFFLYTASSDIAASRHFYTDLIGLEQVWDEADDIAYVVDSVQFSITHDSGVRPQSQWSHQPGWVYGLGIEPEPSHAPTSWSIALDPDHFTAAVARLRAHDVTSLRDGPFWVGYWSFVVLDPMGTTVELSDPTSPGPVTSG